MTPRPLAMRVEPEAGGVYVSLGQSGGAVLSLAETRVLIAQLVSGLQTATELSYERQEPVGEERTREMAVVLP